MKNALIGFIFLLSFSTHAQILNIESFRIKTDTIGWAGKIGLDFSLIKNTKSLTKIGNNTHIQYKTNKSLILLLGQYQLMVSDGTDLIDKAVLHLRYNYNFTRVVIGEWFVQGQRNSISKIDFRGLAGAGLRFKLSKKQQFKYYLGTTAMFEHEETTMQTTQDLWRWSNYFSFSWYPAKTLSLVSTTYYQPAFSDFSDYRIFSQNSLYFLVSMHLSFKTGFNFNFDSTPVAGVPDTQYSLTSGLVYVFK